MTVDNIPLTGRTQATLAPAAGPAYVQRQQAKPCIVILIHGVNDLAGVYADLEEGICQGLNERLDHLATARGARNMAALNPATYTSPKDDNGAAANPDLAYHRRLSAAGRLGGPSRSVVIPFYWGFREEENAINKKTTHGEWLDRFGNRLDKDGIKQGGMFANATTNIPDMFGRGFTGRLLGAVPVNPLFGSPDHPLMQAPGRQYMVLAAQRLAAVVKIIRGYKGESGSDGLNDTINVVGHSQGTLITLLANAFLKDEGHRPIDAFVMMNTPYSLLETLFENMEMNRFQQTTLARLQTLANITQYIGSRASAVPAFTDMADPSKPSCIGGLRWTGGECKTTLDGKEVAFTERDNRGNVYLYFSPEDKTVGMKNVQGIGWQGVGDTVSFTTENRRQPVTPVVAAKRLGGILTGNDYFEETVPALAALGAKFFQRIFTIRVRMKKGHPVGNPPTYNYVLRTVGEWTWEGSSLGLGQRMVANADFTTRQAVSVNAPALVRPFLANFSAHGERDDSKASAGIAPVYAPEDPIDASIAVTNGGMNELGTRSVELPESAGPLSGAYRNRGRAMEFAPQLEAQLAGLNDPARNPYTAPDNNAWAADWHRISSAVYQGGRRFLVTYQESPNEARQRRMNAKMGDLDPYSFHSAIPMNKEHSRRALAYDLALGQARSIDDEGFYAYLCRVADWRLPWADDEERRGKSNVNKELPDSSTLSLFDEELHDRRALIQSTDSYRKVGILPILVVNTKQPTSVISQTLDDRNRNRPPMPGEGSVG
ncbi:DUF3274 domain-containing protein [Achromobacter sp. NPDC058515]|uniref:T6SS effector phospholipase Tle3 domain-containing protein n=1 Tax=Achromobacter sp. NPDC058515 TaxID=3346533 RepID=UPI003654A402